MARSGEREPGFGTFAAPASAAAPSQRAAPTDAICRPNIRGGRPWRIPSLIAAVTGKAQASRAARNGTAGALAAGEDPAGRGERLHRPRATRWRAPGAGSAERFKGRARADRVRSYGGPTGGAGWLFCLVLPLPLVDPTRDEGAVDGLEVRRLL